MKSKKGRADLLFFNLLRFIDPADVEKRVRGLKLENPGLSNGELCRLIIKERSAMCAISGALTTLPAVFPVIGTLVTLVGGIAVDISLIAYFMIRMVMEIAVVNGRNLRVQGGSREILWAFASAVGADAVSKTVSRISVSQMTNQAMVKIVQQVLFSLGIRSTPRVAVRVIPLIGVGIAGVINYLICNKVGKWVVDYYESHSEKDWQETIDVSGKVRN